MVYMLEFQKEMTRSDISHRLSYPSKKLHLLPFEGDGRQAIFEVSCGDGSVYEFFCIKRDGKYPKPTISRGWSCFIRDKGIKVGDRLLFFVEREAQGSARYKIEIQRRPGTLLFGVFLPTAGWNPLL